MAANIVGFRSFFGFFEIVRRTNRSALSRPTDGNGAPSQHNIEMANLDKGERWPISRRRELEFGLEFERNGFDEGYVFSEGSSKPIRDDQVIPVPGAAYFSN